MMKRALARIRSQLSPRRIGFRTQLAVAFTAGILVLAGVSSLATSRLSTDTVRDTLVAQGLRVTATFANQSRLAVLYGSGENAAEAAAGTLDFPDVRGVSVHAADGTRLLHRGAATVPSGSFREATSRPTLVASTDDAWYFVAPVVTGPDAARASSANEFGLYEQGGVESSQPGYVRLVMDKQTLASTASDILQGNVTVAAALATILLLVLLAITRRVTGPLHKLAGIMGRAQAGETHVRAELAGPKDIVDMESAFNTMMDVLEVREDELKRARDTALESARAKGEFAANVSHELRTPMNSILGMLELLEELELDESQREYVHVARNSGEALLLLIDDILDFSRSESGRLELQPVDFYPHDVLHDVVAMLEAQARRKGIGLHYRIDPAVPPAMRGDGQRIRQVLINLVANAIKFTDSGAVSIEVGARYRADGTVDTDFAVIDTGVGIPHEAQERIFEAFTQQDGATNRQYGGTGLGLTICRQLVGLMGGEIGVDSEPGHGSRFWFRLPLHNSPLASGDGSHPLLAGLRVLLDLRDPGECERIERCLRAWELEVTRTPAGGQGTIDALRHAARAHPFDIVLVEDSAAGADGTERAASLARIPELHHVKIITVAPPDRAADVTPSEIAAGLTRPVDPGALYTALLGARRQTRTEIAPTADTNRETPLRAHVLVAEDNAANQRVVAAMLERLGCTCSIVAGGEAAVEAAGSTAVDLVLMDCNMPGVDGFEATRRIRRAETASAEVPVIALTATVREGIWSQCLAAGMNDYLAKPLKLATLRGKLEYWLDTARGAEGSGVAESGPEDEADPDDRPIDATLFAEMQDQLGHAFDEIIESYVADLPLYIGALRAAEGDRNARRLSESAHTLKGSSHNVGAQGIARLCRQLEELGRGDRWTEVARLLDTLDEEAERVRARLLKARGHAARESETPQPPDADAQHVLVADDDRTLRLALRQALERDGYAVAEAADGSQALALCRRELPDLILMDGRMPIMDGFTACARIRELPQGDAVPVLIVTALEEQSFIEQAIDAGATDYIAKPIHFGVLRQRVGGLLNERRARRDADVLAYQDGLTGLPNRAHFIERLRNILDTRHTGTSHTAILFLDLDRFKLVNDTMGHDVGDLLLKAAAERITGCVRDTDVVARLGGDEFAIIMPSLEDTQVAASLARKICRTLARPFTFRGQTVYVTASIGISCHPDDGHDIGALMKHADTAMFRAKERGDSHRFYEPGMEAVVTRQMEIENDLRGALEGDEFAVLYQPRVSLGSGRAVAMEALLRWNPPERGPVSPADFIPLAEANGLIHEIGLWVLEQACRQTYSWLQQGFPPLHVSVNVSGRQLEHPAFPEQVLAVLERTGLPADLLELEITESAIMQRPEEASRMLGGLREHGIRISLDDFGTGYSSLAYLQRFPLDMLKLDRSFVGDIEGTSSGRVLIRGIVALAHALGLRVVAEGVETRDQAEFMRGEQCDEIQGFLIARPLAPGAFEQQFLRSTHRALPALSETSVDRP